MIAERLPQLVWSSRQDGYHDYFNGRWYYFTGYRPSSRLAAPGAGRPSGRSPPGPERWRGALTTGKSYEAEYRVGCSGRLLLGPRPGLPDRNEPANRALVRHLHHHRRSKTGRGLLALSRRAVPHRVGRGETRNLEDRDRQRRDQLGRGQFSALRFPDGLYSLPLDEALQWIHAEDRENVRAKIAAAMAPGSTGIYEVEYRVVLEDGSIRWTRSNGRVFYADDGTQRHVAGLSGVIGDVTDKRSAAEAQELLTRELTHRVKNLFAIANGMVSMTARSAKEPRNGRGLARPIERTVTDSELAQPASVSAPVAGIGVALEQLIDAVLAPYTQGDGNKVAATGPSVSVGSTPRQASRLCCTNLPPTRQNMVPSRPPRAIWRSDGRKPRAPSTWCGKNRWSAHRERSDIRRLRQSVGAAQYRRTIGRQPRPRMAAGRSPHPHDPPL